MNGQRPPKAWPPRYVTPVDEVGKPLRPLFIPQPTPAVEGAEPPTALQIVAFAFAIILLLVVILYAVCTPRHVQTSAQHAACEIRK